MKKRFLLPLLLIGAPIAIGVTDALVHMAGCNLGHKGACAELSRREADAKASVADNKQEVKKDPTAGMSDYESCLYNNKVLEGIGTPYDCERVKNYKTPQQRLAAAGGQTKLIRECEASFRPQLKDPDSYRYTSARIVSDSSETMAVTVLYTATNSFGARIQTTQTCNFRV